MLTENGLLRKSKDQEYITKSMDIKTKDKMQD